MQTMKVSEQRQAKTAPQLQSPRSGGTTGTTPPSTPAGATGGSVVENEAREYRLKASLLEQQLQRQSSEHDSVVQELR